MKGRCGIPLTLRWPSLQQLPAAMELHAPKDEGKEDTRSMPQSQHQICSLARRNSNYAWSLRPCHSKLQQPTVAAPNVFDWMLE